jgi:hypothetical protein
LWTPARASSTASTNEAGNTSVQRLKRSSGMWGTLLRAVTAGGAEGWHATPHRGAADEVLVRVAAAGLARMRRGIRRHGGLARWRSSTAPSGCGPPPLRLPSGCG